MCGYEYRHVFFLYFLEKNCLKKFNNFVTIVNNKYVSKKTVACYDNFIIVCGYSAFFAAIAALNY